MAKHKPRYGGTFHDSLYFSLNNKMQGKVFSFEVDRAGLARSQRSIQVNIAEWEDCVACQEFEHCYKLYRAKLDLETAISRSSF